MEIVKCPQCGSGDVDCAVRKLYKYCICNTCNTSWVEDITKNATSDAPSCAKNAQVDEYPQAKEKNEYRYLSPRWIDAMAYGLTDGQRRYPGEKWRDIPAHEHAWRAIRHLMLFLAGDKKDTHLVNASMRCMMAFETDKAANDVIEWERLMREKGCG